MKRLVLGLLVVSAAPLLYAKGAPKELNVYDFSKGVDTYHATGSLPDGFSQNSLNVLFDAKAPVAKRQGYAVVWSTKSYSYTGLWTYTDQTNTTWQIVRSSDQISANNLNGSTVKIATVSVNNIVGQANAFGYSFFVDQTQGVYYWNGSSTTFVPGSPFGSIIAQFHNRLWVSGLAAPAGNQLYGSKYYDGTTWTTGLNASDPVQVSVGLNDAFDNITAEYVYLDTLYLFKHYSVFALYGFDQTNFQISQLTQECGCIDGNTIQTYNGGLKFVSLRGVEDFNGYTCKRISDPIKDKLDPAIQAGGFSQQSWVQQNQSDWQAGSVNQLSTVIAAPALVLSTFSVTENSSSQWSVGTTSNTTVNSSNISLSRNAVVLLNNSFESGGGINWSTNSQWINQGTSSPQPVCGTNKVDPEDGSKMENFLPNFGTPVPLVIDISDASSGLINETTYNTSTNCTWVHKTISIPSSYIGHLIHIQMGYSFETITSDNFIFNGNDIGFWIQLVDSGGAGDSKEWFVDNFDSLSRSSIFTGSFTSQMYNTGLSSPIYTINGFSYSTNNGASNIPTFDLQTSTASNGLFSEILTTSGTNIVGSQYVKYTSTITVPFLSSLVNGDALTTVNSMSIAATASTGTFKSQIHSLGQTNAFGNFSVSDALNNGNIVFSICSSTMSTMVPPSACGVQTPNSQILISTGTGGTGTYVQWYATFTVTAATQTPTLNNGTVQWFSGSKAIPMASTVWDNRYWLSLATNTADTGNDAVLVLNSRGAWAPFDIHAGGFTQTRNNLYHADSTATGNVYLDNQAYADNGASINAFVKTKDLSFGDLSQDDYLDTLYPSADNLGSCGMTISYNVDRSTAGYSLGTINQTEFQNNSAIRLPVPVDANHQVFGKTFNFTFGSNDSSCPWQFYGAKGIYEERPTQ